MPRFPGTFRLAIRAALDKLKWELVRWHGEGAYLRVEQNQVLFLELSRLYRQVRAVPRSSWPELAQEFLQTLGTLTQPCTDPDLLSLADQVLLQFVIPKHEGFEKVPAWSISLPNTSLKLRLIVATTDPEESTYVTHAMVAATGLDDAYWFAQGLRNLKAISPNAPSLEHIHRNSQISLWHAGDAYTAARTLLIEDLLGSQAEFGVFLSLPSQEEVLLLPVTAEAVEQLHLVKILTDRVVGSTSQTVSDLVYWVYRQQWHPFTITQNDNEITIVPPDAFLPILDLLAPPT